MVDEARRRRQFLFSAISLAILVAAWVNPGNLGSIDATRRLRMAHSWWSGGVEVLPEEERAFGTRSSNGVMRGSFGVGHSLLLLPADLLVTPVVRSLQLPEAAREAAVAFLTQGFTGALLLVAAYRLLRRLGFGHVDSGYGTLALLFLTTALHYVQNAQENLLMTTLAMAGTARLLKWHQDGDWRALIQAGAVLGSSLLIRLTTLADAGAAVLMLLLIDWRRALRALPWFAAGYGALAMVERLVQYARFGNWTGTYYSGILQSTNPETGAPAVFYYNFSKGVARALWRPSDSIFLFDPLLPWAIALVLLFWKRIPLEVRGYVCGALASLTVYVLFYATYQSPTGEASWGDRYVTTPVLLIASLAIPLTLRLMNRMPLWGWVLIAWSLALQLASLALVATIEWRQEVRFKFDSAIPARLVNIWCVWSGEAATAAAFDGFPPEWRTWNLLPFQLRFRHPELARWAVAAWWVIGAAWLLLAQRILQRLARLGARQ